MLQCETCSKVRVSFIVLKPKPYAFQIVKKKLNKKKARDQYSEFENLQVFSFSDLLDFHEKEKTKHDLSL